MLDQVKPADALSKVTDFFCSESLLEIMRDNNISLFGGINGHELVQMISSVCSYMISTNGRNFLPNEFNRNGGLRFQAAGRTKVLGFIVLKLQEITENDKLRKFFIYMSYCILRGFINKDTLQKTTWENIPTFEEWYESITSGPLNYVYVEETMLDDIARLAKSTREGRISKVTTTGILDQSFKLVPE